MKFKAVMKDAVQTAGAGNTLNGNPTDGQGCLEAGLNRPVSTSSTPCPVWRIQRETGRRIDQFEIFLDSKRIGKKRGAAELRGLLIGARVGCDEADRVVAELKMSPMVYVEVHPDESSACGRQSPGGRH